MLRMASSARVSACVSTEWICQIVICSEIPVIITSYYITNDVFMLCGSLLDVRGLIAGWSTLLGSSRRSTWLCRMTVLTEPGFIEATSLLGPKKRVFQHSCVCSMTWGCFFSSVCGRPPSPMPLAQTTPFLARPLISSAVPSRRVFEVDDMAVPSSRISSLSCPR